MQEEYSKYISRIDSLQEIDEIKAFRRTSFMMKLKKDFWIFRKEILTSSDELERERSLAKIGWIQCYFGCAIPITKRIKRFSAPHGLFGIFISDRVKLGKNCVIFPNVVLGSNTIRDSKNAGFPTIGDNVYIGAGAAIIGNVTVGDNCRIGANACVVKDVPPNSVVVGNPMRIIERSETMDNRYYTPKQFSEFIVL